MTTTPEGLLRRPFQFRKLPFLPGAGINGWFHYSNERGSLQPQNNRGNGTRPDADKKPGADNDGSGRAFRGEKCAFTGFLLL